jgi:hypothetical protein
MVKTEDYWLQEIDNLVNGASLVMKQDEKPANAPFAGLNKVKLLHLMKVRKFL